MKLYLLPGLFVWFWFCLFLRPGQCVPQAGLKLTYDLASQELELRAPLHPA